MLDRKRIGSFVIGGLAGIVAGVLLAPRSGRETRDSISDRAGEARQRSRETYFETRERLQEKASLRRDGRGEAEEPAATQAASPSAKPGRTTFGNAPGGDPLEPQQDIEPEGPGGREETAPPTVSRPFLKDVSREAPEDTASDAARSEELRRKVRETRERLRGRPPADTRSEDTRSEDDGSASEE